ncbi:MAG: succinylglutamate desuccinylase/aspartoacylase family protein [Bacteroidaceae bacterium]|nr:succinylglutamate desuccinylase/aspartoacylase family protein [Bacteroidaceae bacterium]
MRKQTIFRMSSPYRDDFRIKAYTFGEGSKALCIVGSMRGDEMQQLYIAGQLVERLREAEAQGCIPAGVSVSVIPCANPFSVNIEKRFWALDGTDINRMFPGYDRGETTQRIAAGLFEYIKDFSYGIQLASYYLPGHFLPHVRMMRTGREDVEDAILFGFPYVAVKEPQPFDTVLLNYNWQIWDCRAFSLYAGTTETIEPATASTAIHAILRFIWAKGMLTAVQEEAGMLQAGVVVDEDRMVAVKAPRAGILMTEVHPGQKVAQGQVIARILHSYEGRTVSEVKAPCHGTVFFARNRSIAFQNTLLFRLVPE